MMDQADIDETILGPAKVAPCGPDAGEADFLQVLSPNVLLMMARHLSPGALSNCRLVCKAWCNIVTLAVDSLHIKANKKPQHTIHNIQHAFPRLKSVIFRPDFFSLQHAAAILAALSSQKLLAHMTVARTCHTHYHSTPAAQDFGKHKYPLPPSMPDLPQHLVSLSLTTCCSWTQQDSDALSELTALTSFTFSWEDFRYWTHAEHVQLLFSALAGLPNLQELSLWVTRVEQLPGENASAAWLRLTVSTIQEHFPLLPSLQRATLKGDVAPDADIVKSLAAAVKHSAGPNLQWTIIEFNISIAGTRKCALRITPSGHIQVQKREVMMPLLQEQTACQLSAFPFPGVPPATAQMVEGMDVQCSVHPDVDVAQLQIDLQQLPSLASLSIQSRHFIIEAANMPTAPRQHSRPQQLMLTVSNANQLTRLTISRISMSFACSVALHCTRLLSLEIPGMSESLQPLLTELTRLTDLHCWSGSSNPASVQFHLKWLPPALTHLKIEGYHVIGCAHEEQPKLPALLCLKLFACKVSDAQAIQSFSSASQSLEELGLSLMQPYPDLALAIKAAAETFYNVQHMWTSNSLAPMAGEELPASATLECLHALAGLKNLVDLCLPLAVYNRDAIQCLTGMTQLEELSLKMVPDNSTRAMAYIEQLASMTRLHTLRVSCTAYDPEHSSMLQRMFEDAREARHVKPQVEISYTCLVNLNDILKPNTR